MYLGCPDSLWVVMHYSLLLAPHHQILQAGSHCVSYVLVRGSVPVFWTQPGSKYRPPPIIERGIIVIHNLYIPFGLYLHFLSLSPYLSSCLFLHCCTVIHTTCFCIVILLFTQYLAYLQTRKRHRRRSRNILTIKSPSTTML